MSAVAGTEPYPWPYHGELGASLVLVLAGWDRGWHDRVAGEAPPIVERCRALAEAVVTAGGSVVAVAHGGAAALPVPVLGATAVTAEGLDGFWGGPLDQRLRAAGALDLLVAGLGLEGPVHSLLRGANDRGYECLLVLDACAAADPTLREASASMVCMSGGIFGAVGEHSEVLAALAALIPTGAPT